MDTLGRNGRASRRDCFGYAALAALAVGGRAHGFEDDKEAAKEGGAEGKAQEERQYRVVTKNDPGQESIDVYPEVVQQRTVSDVNEDGLIEPDSRTPCTDMGSRPHCAVCQIKVVFPHETKFATGFLVKRRLVVTVAHALTTRFDIDHSPNPGNVIVKPGLTDTYAAPAVPVLLTRVPPEWRASFGTDFGYDFGFIKLAQDAPAAATPIDMSNYEYRTDRYNAWLCGYPQNMPRVTQYEGRDKILSDLMTPSGKSIIHLIDATRGTSGGPITIVKNFQRVAIGIHCGVLDNGRNFGRRIDQTVQDFILNTA